MIKFKESEIRDKAYLETEIESEAQRIFKSSKANKGRSIETIREKVRQGKTAEVWMIENWGFKAAKDVYHDLIDSEGNLIEVKAYNPYNCNTEYIQNVVEKLKSSVWNQSKWLFLFEYDNGTYTFLKKIAI